MTTVATVGQVVDRLSAIDGALEPDDGVAVFDRMYLTVTRQIDRLLAEPGTASVFEDPAALAELDARFASMWLHAYDASVHGSRMTTAWAPLFEARYGARLPIQYALAGMNTHIEHDLPIAVVRTCRARGTEPDVVHHDYEAVNDVLADVEARIRRSFLDEATRGLDDDLEPVVHLVSSWDIAKAREVAWVSAETIWELRDTEFLLGRYLTSLGHTVGMASRALLTPLG
jgi:hypothetical protein